jgi:hypothetical protein
MSAIHASAVVTCDSPLPTTNALISLLDIGAEEIRRNQTKFGVEFPRQQKDDDSKYNLWQLVTLRCREGRMTYLHSHTNSNINDHPGDTVEVTESCRHPLL